MNKLNFFWGRENCLRLLSNQFFITTPGASYCGTINGANGIGKTLLMAKAREFFEEKDHENVYYFSVSMMTSSSYFGFWRDLVLLFSETIDDGCLQLAPKANPLTIKFIKNTYKYFAEATDCADDNVTRNVTTLFSYYAKLGIHILISIDEFDLAKTAFPKKENDHRNGVFFKTLYALSPKGAPGKYLLSIICIARQTTDTIVHGLEGGSNFKDAYPPHIVLRGFTDKNLEDYFQSYASLPCGIPDDERKKDILYFCGRHPGMLMEMRRMYDFFGDQYADYNPAEIYRDHGSSIISTYERITELMRKEGDFSSFIEAFIGPAYSHDLDNKIKAIYMHGFLNQRPINEKSIFQIAGFEYDTDSISYEPLSPFYINYVKRIASPEELTELGRSLEKVELNTRTAILECLKQESPSEWEEIIDSFTTDTKRYFRRNLDLIVLKGGGNKNYTNLDVMAFNDYARIIMAHWRSMKLYFRSFDGHIKKDFCFLNDCRNCYAHNNARLLPNADITMLRDICNRLLDDYEKGLKQEPLSDEHAVVHVTDGFPVPNANEQEIMRGKHVIFCCTEKKNNGNLRGFIKGNNYPGGISYKRISEKCHEYDNLVGKEIEAVVIEWNSNPSAGAGMFNLDLLN